MLLARFHVPGDPVTWKRPGRVARELGQAPAAFTERSHRNYQDVVGLLARQAYRGPLLAKVPIGVEAVWHIKTAQRARVGRYCHGTPDVDNLLKLLMDAMQGVIYETDAQVAKAAGTTIWAPPKQAGATITITRLEE